MPGPLLPPGLKELLARHSVAMKALPNAGLTANNTPAFPECSPHRKAKIEQAANTNIAVKFINATVGVAYTPPKTPRGKVPVASGNTATRYCFKATHTTCVSCTPPLAPLALTTGSTVRCICLCKLDLIMGACGQGSCHFLNVCLCMAWLVERVCSTQSWEQKAFSYVRSRTRNTSLPSTDYRFPSS
jgi:hypothetical protein